MIGKDATKLWQFSLAAIQKGSPLSQPAIDTAEADQDL